MKPDPGPPRRFRARAKPQVLTVRHGQAILVETPTGKGRRTLRISAGRGTKLTVINPDEADLPLTPPVP